ncbi:MAG: imidazole glycerol phosphate synthase subunit HisF [Ignavibacteriaceae bacterium]
MLCKRIIPCLDVKDGRVVKGTNFINLVDAGSPVELAARYSNEGADELVFLDITASAEKRNVGGGISELKDIEVLLKSGADKVSLNTSIVKNPELITQASKQFGCQAVVAAIDVKLVENTYKIFIKGGSEETELEGFSWCENVTNLGAGEILLTSMDRDGTKFGYDIEFLKELTSLVTVPVIASGGAGKKEDFLDAFQKADVDACLAASLFHFNILPIKELKEYLNNNGINVRL